MLGRSARSAASLDLNYRVILGSRFFVELDLGVDVLDVQSDVVSRRVEQLGHLLLREPGRLVLEPHIEAHLTVRGLIEDDLAAVVLRGLVHVVLEPSDGDCAAQG